MKYLGIDYGDERIGLAISDHEERMAFALATLSRKTLPSKEAFYAALLNIIEEHNAEGVVVGLPLPLTRQLDASQEPLTCRKARNFAASLARRCPVPIYLVNEALSSSEAESRLQEAGFKGQKLKEKLDAEAAAVILQQFLNLPQEKRTRYEP